MYRLLGAGLYDAHSARCRFSCSMRVPLMKILAFSLYCSVRKC